MQRSLKFISKKMSYALRHNPQKYGITLDEYGYTDLPGFITAMNRVHHFQPALTRQTIEDVIANSSKQRFEIKNNKICALYGHSIPGIIKHQEAAPPAVLYHGTSHRALKSIEELGLLPMSRQFVHLSADIPMARQVGSRHDPHPVILAVDAKAASDNGLKFYVGNSEVWLCDDLPFKYIHVIES